MANNRPLRPGQVVMLDAPDVFFFVVRHCRVAASDGDDVRLESEDPLPYLPSGSTVLLWTFGDRRQREAEVVDTPSAHATVVRLAGYRERRASPRFRAVVDIALEPAGQPDAAAVRGVTQNVSETGLRTWLRARLLPGQRALATVHVARGEEVTGIVEVIHTALAPRDGLYDTRLRITSISAEDQSRLRRFLLEDPRCVPEPEEGRRVGAGQRR